MTNLGNAPEQALETSQAPLTRISGCCVECGDPLHVRIKGPGKHKRFCDSTCRVAFANREKAEGSVLVTVAKVWRRTRGSGELGKAAFAEMTKILDLLNERERKAGRTKRLESYVEQLLRSGDSYQDRMDENRQGRRR